MDEPVFLSALRPGERGTVRRMSNTGPIRRRLRDLGLVEGTAVRCLGRSPWGDPAAFEVCGAVLALRRSESGQILVTREARP